MKPLLPNTYVINNKYLQSIISPSTDIIDYNFSSDQIHKLNLLQILRPDIYFNKSLSDNEFFDLSKKYYQRLIDEQIIYKSDKDYVLHFEINQWFQIPYILLNQSMFVNLLMHSK